MIKEESALDFDCEIYNNAHLFCFEMYLIEHNNIFDGKSISFLNIECC